MMGQCRRAVTVAVLGVLTASPVHALGDPAGPSTGTEDCEESRVACAAASGDGYDVSVPIIIHNGSSETIGDVAHRTIQTLRDYAPACTGNTRTDVSVLCTGATTACPDPADISYWVWVKTVYADTGEVVTDWEKQVDTVCLGPAEAGIPKAAAIAGAVAREFARAVVLRAKVSAEPSGTTLVHYRTGFYTEATDYELPTLTLLGSRVRVFAHPERYDWTFGDGSTLPDG